MRLVLLIVDERCNRNSASQYWVTLNAECRTAFHPARPQRSQLYYVSTVWLSKCKMLHSIQHSLRGSRTDQADSMLIETNGTNTLESYSTLWPRYCILDSISVRWRLFKSICTSICLTQGGEDGKSGTNCTLTFTRHWTTFFGTRVQTCDLSCQGMIHAFVSRCQKEKES